MKKLLSEISLTKTVQMVLYSYKITENTKWSTVIESRSTVTGGCGKARGGTEERFWKHLQEIIRMSINQLIERQKHKRKFQDQGEKRQKDTLIKNDIIMIWNFLKETIIKILFYQMWKCREMF